MKASKPRVLILGAAGRDFHNFNVLFRDNSDVEVVAFTATQIPKIEGRTYPKQLAGKLYPKGIPILPERDMEEIIAEHEVDTVVFAYSDVSHETVMHLGSRAAAAGADFMLLAPMATMIASKTPVISVCAVRTGCGKSQTARKVAAALIAAGLKVSLVRHPMPYGDLAKQAVQRFSKLEDFVTHKCTIEEIEEYEHYVERGMVVYAGVDYEKILRAAESESDVVIWDGGNNDTPFYAPDIQIVVVDPLRPGHELKYHPGETNLRMADVIVVNKAGMATRKDLTTVTDNIRAANPEAVLVLAESEISVEDSKQIKGRRVLVVEDGPTLTHGGMSYGAGFVAAKKFKAKEIIDPRKYAVGPIAQAYKTYPHIGPIVPALGYYPEQLKALEDTINAARCDAVVIGTPVDLRRFLKLNKPAVRVTYDLAERKGAPRLDELVLAVAGKKPSKRDI